MGQFDVFEEPRSLNVVGVIENEFSVLSRRALEIFAQFFPAQRAVDQGHGDRLALRLAKDQPVASGELRRLGFRAGELVDGFAFRQGHFPDLDRKTQFGDLHLNGNRSDPQLTHKSMVAPVAALRGIGEAKRKPFIRAGQRLQTQGAVRGHFQWFAGQVRRGRVVRASPFDQPFTVQKFRDMGHPTRLCLPASGLGCLTICGQFEVQQTVRVVKGRAQNLSAGQVLEGGRDTSVAGHTGSIDRLGRPKARQRGSIGADEEDRFDQIAPRLLDRKSRKVGIVKRAFGHDTVDSKAELLANLRDAELGDSRVTPAFFGKPGMGVLNCPLAPFDGYIHVRIFLLARPRRHLTP